MIIFVNACRRINNIEAGRANNADISLPIKRNCGFLTTQLRPLDYIRE
jgi:hypothetical protein